MPQASPKGRFLLINRHCVISQRT